MKGKLFTKKKTVVFLMALICLLSGGGILIKNQMETAKAGAARSVQYVEKGKYTIGITEKSVWKSNSKQGCVYHISLKNDAANVINGWKMSLEFPVDVTVSQMWSAKHQVSGRIITTSAMDYNSSIQSQKTLEYGFILQSSKKIAPSQIKVTYNGITYTGGTKSTSMPQSTNIPQTTKATTTASAVTVKPTQGTATKAPTVTQTPVDTAKVTTAPATAYANPNDYVNKTTITVLPKNTVDISGHTQEFKGLVQECTKVAYAYADPRENADSTKNTSVAGTKSLAVYIFGYNNVTDAEFLAAKKAVPYVLNKLYFDSKWNSTWYKQLVGKHPVYIILERAGASDGWAGVKFGNPNDGFGMRIAEGCMKNSYGSTVLYHEMSHCIWDCGVNINDFYFGVDPRTNIDYGTGNFLKTFEKLYNNSIKTNTFYQGSYGWEYSHENYAQSACSFFDPTWRTKLKANDPIVYNILKQIYTEF